MRVNPNNMPDLLLALTQTSRQENESLLQMSTGRRMNRPSDDPSAAAEVLQNHDQSRQIDTFQKSMSSIEGPYQIADSALSSVVTALQRAISLGVQAGNSATLSASNRAAIVAELQGIQGELINLGNTSYQGRFLFAGTSQAQPFVADGTVPSGVRYDGNAGKNSLLIGNSFSVQMNVPGSQLFAGAGADMFASIQDMITAVTNNAGIDTAVTGVRTAFDHVTAERTFYGNALAQISAQKNYLSQEQLQLNTQENTLVGVDPVAAASNLVNAQNARNATLAAMGRRTPTTLFDYLK